MKSETLLICRNNDNALVVYYYIPIHMLVAAYSGNNLVQTYTPPVPTQVLQ
jgi:hypothetical protein